MVSAVVLLSTVLSGCSSWSVRPTALATQPKPGDVWEIWVAGHGQVYHQIRISNDSLHAMMRKVARACQTNSCDRSMALSDIDSVRVSRVSGSKVAIWTMGSALGLIALVVVGFSQWDPGGSR
jgi:hypothetical protein